MTLNLLIVGQTVFELWIKTVKMLIGSITQEPLGLPKFWWYFWVPRTIYKVLCFELIWINWQIRWRFVVSESKNQVLSFSSEWYMGVCKTDMRTGFEKKKLEWNLDHTKRSERSYRPYGRGSRGPLKGPWWGPEATPDGGRGGEAPWIPMAIWHLKMHLRLHFGSIFGNNFNTF